MLAPLIRCIPPASIRHDVAAAFCVGRGQLLGIHGPRWREYFSLLQEAATAGETRHARIELNDEAGLDGCCARMAVADAPPLWLIALQAPFTADQIRPLLGQLENLGQQGGGAVIGADHLPDDLPLTQIIMPPELFPPIPTDGGLLDDQDLPVNFLRHGDWGALRFSLGGTLSLRALESVQLIVTGGDESWNSEPVELKPWKSLAACPAFCTVSFAAPWAPGNYVARLLFSGVGRGNGEQSSDIRIRIRPSAVNPHSGGRHVQWRFSGAPPVPRYAAQLHLSLPVRAQLECGNADRDYLLEGWHEAEALGENQFRRWTQSRATALIGGPGNRLRVTLEDRRPRLAADDSTRMTLRIDNLPPSEQQWQQPGRRVVEAPWPDDGVLHQLVLEIVPAWSPKKLGLSEDAREFGALIYSLKVFHGE